MSTSLLVPADWMVKDGSNSVDDVVKDNAAGGWVKIHANGTKELLHSLKAPGNAAPVISSVTNHADGTYTRATALSFTVVFNENVTVAGGTPRLPVYSTDPGTIVYLDLASGSGTTNLVFTGATTGVAAGSLVVVPEIDLNGSTIKDAAGNICNNDFPSNYVQPTITLT